MKTSLSSVSNGISAYMITWPVYFPMVELDFRTFQVSRTQIEPQTSHASTNGHRTALFKLQLSCDPNRSPKNDKILIFPTGNSPKSGRAWNQRFADYPARTDYLVRYSGPGIPAFDLIISSIGFIESPICNRRPSLLYALAVICSFS